MLPINKTYLSNNCSYDYNNPQYAVRYGLNTSVLKHTIYGDAFTMSCEDIETFMAANGSAEVVR